MTLTKITRSFVRLAIKKLEFTTSKFLAIAVLGIPTVKS